MLRIVTARSAEVATKYFTGQNGHGYLSEDRERIGTWHGKGAELLGLSGEVSAEAFGALAFNKHPTTGERLTVRSKANRRVGYDFNFHAPKSLSVLHAFNKDDRVVVAFNAAVREIMLEIEKDMQTRVRKNGIDTDRTTGNMAWAQYTHMTARPVNGIPDPHIHGHCFVFNTTYDEQEKRWKAGQFHDLKRHAPYFEAIFHSKLAAKIQELGYRIVKSEKTFEIEGVPTSLNAKFSRRTAHIEEVAKKLGITKDASKSKLGAATREKKRTDLDLKELRNTWLSRATPEETRAMQEASPRQTSQRTFSYDGEAERRALDYACRHLMERNSVVEERQILTAALQYGVKDVDLAKLQAMMSTHPSLIRKLVDGRTMVTTREVLAEEKYVTDFAKRGHNTVAPLASGHRIQDQRLTEEQRAALRHILESRSRISGVQGRAGVGKTTLMQETIAAIKANGHNIVVLAPTAEASRGVLRSEGFADAETVQQLFVNEELQMKAANGVLWVDEGALVSVRDLKRVIEVAERVNARLVLSGDSKQHRSVGRGESMRLLQEHGGVEFAEVTTIRRQKGAYREAVTHIAEGRIAEGFAKLDSMGAIREAPDDERFKMLAAEYLQALRDKASALVIAPTHAECRAVTEVIRHELKAADKLQDVREASVLRKIDFSEAQRGEVSNYRKGWTIELVKAIPGHRAGTRLQISEVVDGRVYVQKGKFAEHAFDVGRWAERFQVYEPAKLEIGVGERVRITKNGNGLGLFNRFYNGSIQKVAGFTEEGNIRFESGRVVSRDFAHIDYGYAGTSYSAQGKTVKRVFLCQGTSSIGAASLRQFYVSISRGKELVRIYTDDKAALQQAIGFGNEKFSAMDIALSQQPSERSEEIRRAQERAEREELSHPTNSYLGRCIDIVSNVVEHLKRDVAPSREAITPTL